MLFVPIYATLIFNPFQNKNSVKIYGTDMRNWNLTSDCRIVSETEVKCNEEGRHIFTAQNNTVTVELTQFKCIDYAYTYNGTHLIVKLDLYGMDMTEILHSQGIKITMRRRNLEHTLHYESGHYTHEIEDVSLFWEVVQLSAGRVLFGLCPIRDRAIQLKLRAIFAILLKYSFFTKYESNFNTTSSSFSGISYEAVLYSTGSNLIKYIGYDINSFQTAVAVKKLSLSSFGMMIQSVELVCYYFDLNQAWQKDCNQFVLSGVQPLIYAIEKSTISISEEHELDTNFTLIDINSQYLSLRNDSGYYLYDFSRKTIDSSNETYLNDLNSDLLINSDGLFLKSGSSVQSLDSIAFQNVIYIGRSVYAYNRDIYFGRVDDYTLYRTEINHDTFYCNLIGYCTFIFDNMLLEIDFNEFSSLKKYFFII
eukprot:NODE_302_length_11399_cov_0.339115.p3 type:complete len:422 gc:universal NODE_302_length_11399_cov_0.339115:5269-4004(-)